MKGRQEDKRGTGEGHAALALGGAPRFSASSFTQENRTPSF